MKRYLAFFMTGVMVLSLTGCGPNLARLRSITGAVKEAVVEEIKEGRDKKDDKDDKDDDKDNDDTDSISSTLADEGSSEASEESTENRNDSESFYMTPDGSPVYMAIDKYYYEASDNGDNTQLYDGHTQLIMLVDDDKEKFPELNKTLTELYNERTAHSDKRCKEATADAKTDLEDGHLNGPYSDTYELSVQRSDSRILSYYYDYYIYTNGAHGMYGILPYVIDVKTGKNLALSDVITIDNDKLKAVLIEKIKASAVEKGEDPSETFLDLEDTLSHYHYDINKVDNSGDDTENYQNVYYWYLGNDGVHFYFAPYEISAYAYGTTDVFIGYDEMPEIFKKEYLPDSNSKAFIRNIGTPYESMIDLDCDGKNEKLSVEYDYEDGDTTYSKDLTMKVNDSSATIKEAWIDTTNSYTKYYHVHTKDGRNYIYVVAAEASDYYNLFVFEVSGDEIKEVKNKGEYTYAFTLAYVGNSVLTEGSGEICMINPDSFYLGSRYDLFGSFSVVGRYHVGADGYPESDSNDYPVPWHMDTKITSKTDLTADIVDKDGNVISKDEVIKKGESFRPVMLHINGEEYSIDTELSDGRFARLKYSDIEYPARIDGESIDDIFEGLMYAG